MPRRLLANIFLGKYEKLGKYFPYCIRYLAITKDSFRNKITRISVPRGCFDGGKICKLVGLFI